MEDNTQIPGQMSIYDFPEYLPDCEYVYEYTHNKEDYESDSKTIL